MLRNGSLHTCVCCHVYHFPRTLPLFQERTAVGALDIPAELTLCRLLVAVIDILDVPRAFLKEAASRSRFLQLRYDLFGRREVIRLKNPLLRERGAIAGEGVINDKETNPSLRTEPERLERVQVKYFRSSRVC